MSSGIKVTAPVTISNINCGFDVLGIALEHTCDEIIGREHKKPGIHLNLVGPNARATPADPAKNTATVAIMKMLEFLGDSGKVGLEINLRKTIYPGSGLGSSAASACAAVMIANELLGRPLEKKMLLPFAILGEYAADQAFHADNVAPCLLGGVIMVRDIRLLDVHRIFSPPGLYITVISPDVQILTSEARAVLRDTVPLKDTIKQTANIAAFVQAMHTGNFDLLSRSLQDHVIERQRSALIPGFDEVKEIARDQGVLGFGISGSGPTMFALSQNENVARDTGQAIAAYYDKKGIETRTIMSLVNHEGTVLC
jgi:homoserine kinase